MLSGIPPPRAWHFVQFVIPSYFSWAFERGPGLIREPKSSCAHAAVLNNAKIAKVKIFFIVVIKKIDDNILKINGRLKNREEPSLR